MKHAARSGASQPIGRLEGKGLDGPDADEFKREIAALNRRVNAAVGRDEANEESGEWTDLNDFEWSDPF